MEPQELSQPKQPIMERKKRKREEDVTDANTAGQGCGADSNTERQKGSCSRKRGLAGGKLRSKDPGMKDRIRQMQQNALGYRVTCQR